MPPRRKKSLYLFLQTAFNMIKKLSRYPFLVFLPFLFYYGYLIVLNKWPTYYGDEVRYVQFAKNLLHGFYSPPAPHIDLWNGPGFPLLLAPFIAFHIPALYITLMNAVYQYLSVVFLYKAIKLVAGYQIALVCALLLAVYPNAASMLPILYTESFTYFLVSCFIYCSVLCYVKGGAKYMVLAGLILGFLTLTKIIFGYVLVISLVVCLAALLFKRYKVYCLRSIKILLIAFAVTVPYLAYTYHITGKVFYWGNSGGMSLYWMSTPFAHEYGDWKVPDLTNNQYPTLFKSAEVVAILHKNHASEIKYILNHDAIKQDELFKERALFHIEDNPLKFIRNYYDNCSRMLFNFPYSYAYQDGAIVTNIVVGSLILWASVAGIILTIINWRGIVFPVKLLLLVTGVYLMLSGVLSAYPRQLDVVLPVLLFWLGFLKANTKKLDLKFAGKTKAGDVELVDLAGIAIYTQDIALITEE